MSASTNVSRAITFTLPEPILRLLDAEAKAVRQKRTVFVRSLLTRSMGMVNMRRLPTLPPVDLPMPVRSKRVQLTVSLTERLYEYLALQRAILGGAKYSSLIALLLFDWCGLLKFSLPRPPQAPVPLRGC